MAIEEKKKKQGILLAIVAVVLAGILFLLINQMTGGSSGKKRKKAQTFEFEEVGTREALKAWYVNANKRLDAMEEKLGKIAEILNNLQQNIEENKKRQEKLEKEFEQLKKQVTELPPVPPKTKKRAGKKEEVKRGAKSPSAAPPREQVSQAPVPPPPPPPPNAKGAKGKKLGGGIVRISFEKELKKRQKKVEEKRYELLRKFYIPSGTFVEGILLSGLDAPTGVGAKKNTIPVLITLVDNSILPNDWRQDLKDCRIIGEGFGDLSSERVYIRTDYMSCVDDEGNVYDFSLEGYVAGEDGKVGLRGRVVSKQGALIARAFIASFFEGAGNILQTTATNVTVTGSGVVSTVQPGEAVRAGVYSGFAEAAKKLADYYMKLLNQTFPVIEIGAGRRVTIVVQKGRWIRRIGKAEQVEKVAKKGGSK